MDVSHLQHADDLFKYIELTTGKPVDDQQKEYLYGVLNLTYGDGYERSHEVARQSIKEGF